MRPPKIVKLKSHLVRTSAKTVRTITDANAVYIIGSCEQLSATVQEPTQRQADHTRTVRFCQTIAGNITVDLGYDILVISASNEGSRYTTSILAKALWSVIRTVNIEEVTCPDLDARNDNLAKAIQHIVPKRRHSAILIICDKDRSAEIAPIAGRVLFAEPREYDPINVKHLTALALRRGVHVAPCVIK